MAENWPTYTHSSPNAGGHGSCPGCAALQRQLHEAQEERDEARRSFRFQQYLQMRCELAWAEAERDAAIKRGVQVCTYVRDVTHSAYSWRYDALYWRERTRAAEKRGHDALWDAFEAYLKYYEGWGRQKRRAEAAEALLRRWVEMEESIPGHAGWGQTPKHRQLVEESKARFPPAEAQAQQEENSDDPTNE